MRPQRQKTLLARDHIMALQLQHKWTFRTIAGASSTAERKANKATKAANAARKLSAVPPVDLKMSATGEGEVAPSPGLEHKWLPHAAAPPEPHAGGKRKHPVGGYAEVAARRHPAADAPRESEWKVGRSDLCGLVWFGLVWFGSVWLASPQSNSLVWFWVQSLLRGAVCA